jgi:selenocysteine lyase/cysteine desulfurase
MVERSVRLRMPTAAAQPAAPARTNPFRAFFPALASEAVFLDNAGGSQLPGAVIDAMHRYLTTSFVQTGADYAASKAATATVKQAHEHLKTLMGVSHAASTGEVIIGASTSQLCRMLADCYADVLSPSDEVILCETAHESNVGPWMRLAKQGVTIKTWKICGASMFGEVVESAGGPSRMKALKDLITSRTKLIAFPQVSNILDVDWYVYSTYKVFGPHAAAMYGKADAMAELTGPNHYFIPRTEVPRKFELGGANHESCAAIAGLEAYLTQAAKAWGGVPHPPEPRAIVERAFHAFEVIENDLQRHFMQWLLAQPTLRVVGPANDHPSRVCTISFVSTRGVSSKAIAQHCNAKGLGIRYGNFYAYRLCEALGLNPADGVVRASFAHYNTHEEVDRLIAALAEII